MQSSRVNNNRPPSLHIKVFKQQFSKQAHRTDGFRNFIQEQNEQDQIQNTVRKTTERGQDQEHNNILININRQAKDNQNHQGQLVSPRKLSAKEINRRFALQLNGVQQDSKSIVEQCSQQDLYSRKVISSISQITNNKNQFGNVEPNKSTKILFDNDLQESIDVTSEEDSLSLRSIDKSLRKKQSFTQSIPSKEVPKQKLKYQNSQKVKRSQQFISQQPFSKKNSKESKATRTVKNQSKNIGSEKIMKKINLFPQNSQDQTTANSTRNSQIEKQKKNDCRNSQQYSNLIMTFAGMPEQNTELEKTKQKNRQKKQNGKGNDQNLEQKKNEGLSCFLSMFDHVKEKKSKGQTEINSKFITPSKHNQGINPFTVSNCSNMANSGSRNIFNESIRGTTSSKKLTHLDPKVIENLYNKSLDKSLYSLKQQMKNQKNLKLKDYLRLASLSSDSKYQKKIRSKSLKRGQVNNLIDSQPLDQGLLTKKDNLQPKKQKTIDADQSINLIKTALKKKLRNTMKQANRILDEIQNDNLVEDNYEDLVFMCNIHRAFDQNIFQSSRTLKDLFNQYKQKRHMTVQDLNSILEALIKMSKKKTKQNNLIKSIMEMASSHSQYSSKGQKDK